MSSRAATVLATQNTEVGFFLELNSKLSKAKNKHSLFKFRTLLIRKMKQEIYEHTHTHTHKNFEMEIV